MKFDLIKCPINNTKPEILFFEILKISHDEGKLTQEILNNKDLYENFKISIYNQFDLGEIYEDEEVLENVTHPLQYKCYPEFGKCLCSQCNLRYHCVVENRLTGKSAWVGSKCITKFLTHLKEDMTKKIKILENYKQGNICNYCEETLTDLRLKHQKNGFCDSICYRKYHYKIPFGKFKNINMIEFLASERGSSYRKWIEKTILDDSNAFSQYPLFLLILKENDFVYE